MKTTAFVRQKSSKLLAAIACIALAAACRSKSDPSGAEPAPAPLAPAAPSASASAAPRSAPAIAPIPLERFGRLVTELSERDEYFFSDNFVSNETSYLQPTALLETHAAPGGAYLGVGPEQNFTYITLTRPKIAFIVDIRRQNMLQHLLYKAVFEEAKSRSHFLCLMLGRAWSEQDDPGADADVSAVIRHAETNEPSREVFEETHGRLRQRIDDGYAVELSKKDHATLKRTHEAFFKDQLDLKFVLKEGGGRKYPALRELLVTQDPEGNSRGFLAQESAFRAVQRMQRANRIIPVVGDFAGDRALPGIAKELSRRKVAVSVFYVSNVEQYLLEDAKWQKWVRNIDALPSNEKTLFLRAYLNQGRAHPLEMKGHRTTTVLQKLDHFKWRQRKRGYGGFWQLATDGVLGMDAGAP